MLHLKSPKLGSEFAAKDIHDCWKFLEISSDALLHSYLINTPHRYYLFENLKTRFDSHKNN